MKGTHMKYEVKGLTSYGVYDGDRLLRTYESEKAATLVAEALNEETVRAAHERAELKSSLTDPDVYAARDQVVPGPDHKPGLLAGATAQDHWTLNGQDKETI